MIRKRNWLVFTGTVIVASFFLAGMALFAFQEQPSPQLPPIYAMEPPRSGQYLGPASCASSNCHGSVKPRDVYDIKQNEYFTWLKQDRHTQAYNILLDERSARIARNMKLKVNAYESPVCLDCHALNVPKAVPAQRIDLPEGISCEACHGPAGGWIAGHTEAGWSYEMSLKRGMKDLRNLVTRAQICLGCHLGDAQKTVDHELIAAGHPDLLFELDNFTAAMPPHWTPFAEKRNKAGWEVTDGPRAWVVGQATAFLEGMQQIARRARSEKWPEFGEMDCYACHHSLKQGGWRQERGYKLTAGLPRWSRARFAVLRHLISVFAPQERNKITEQVELLSTHIAKMNTPPEIVSFRARALAESIGGIVPRILQAEVDSARAKRLIGMIADDVSYLIESDLHSVEQAIMSINALFISMARKEPGLAESPMAKVIDRLYNDVQDPEAFDAKRFAEHMAELRRLLQ